MEMRRCRGARWPKKLFPNSFPGKQVGRRKEEKNDRGEVGVGIGSNAWQLVEGLKGLPDECTLVYSFDVKKAEKATAVFREDSNDDDAPANLAQNHFDVRRERERERKSVFSRKAVVWKQMVDPRL